MRTGRDERHDEDGEPHGGDGLRDGEGGAEAEELHGNKDPDCEPTAHAQERVARGREAAVACEEDELGGDAVCLQGLHSHDEKEAREHTVRDEV